jgi:hypothetical protein
MAVILTFVKPFYYNLSKKVQSGHSQTIPNHFVRQMSSTARDVLQEIIIGVLFLL